MQLACSKSMNTDGMNVYVLAMVMWDHSFNTLIFVD